MTLDLPPVLTVELPSSSTVKLSDFLIPSEMKASHLHEDENAGGGSIRMKTHVRIE